MMVPELLQHWPYEGKSKFVTIVKSAEENKTFRLELVGGGIASLLSFMETHNFLCKESLLIFTDKDPDYFDWVTWKPR